MRGRRGAGEGFGGGSRWAPSPGALCGRWEGGGCWLRVGHLGEEQGEKVKARPAGGGCSWASRPFPSLLPPRPLLVSWGSLTGPSPRGAEIQPRCPGLAGSSPPHPSAQLLVVKPREREMRSDRQTDRRLSEGRDRGRGGVEGVQAELRGPRSLASTGLLSPSCLSGAS